MIALTVHKEAYGATIITEQCIWRIYMYSIYKYKAKNSVDGTRISLALYRQDSYVSQ